VSTNKHNTFEVAKEAKGERRKRGFILSSQQYSSRSSSSNISFQNSYLMSSFAIFPGNARVMTASSATQSSSSSAGVSSRGAFHRLEHRHRHRAKRRKRRVFAKAEEESFFEKLNPFKKKENALTTTEREQQMNMNNRKNKKNELINSTQREQLFGKGLMGRVATGVINNLAGQLAEGMSEMRTNVEDAYEIARSKCEKDGKLREALGGEDVIVGPVTTQMSNSMNVNGKRTDVTRIGMIASSSSGNKVASIAVTMESVTTGKKSVTVVATLRNGESFEVDGVGGGGVGRNVDVVIDANGTNTRNDDDEDFFEGGEIIEASFDDASSSSSGNDNGNDE
tara:strand:+ start:1198 stop:2211 length:1014 start_codon:yes stop_codon:yes gene_type:complete